jgi:PAS domain-containing protein
VTGDPRERELRTRDGRCYLSRVRPYRVGVETTGVAVTFTDITERRLAEDKLHESEARLASDLAGMHRLYQLHAKLARETDLQAAL